MKTKMLVVAAVLAAIAILPMSLAAGSYFSGGFFYPRVLGQENYMTSFAGQGLIGPSLTRGYSRIPVVNGMQWINPPLSMAGTYMSGIGNYGVGTSFSAYSGLAAYGAVRSPMVETVFQAAQLPETHQEVFKDVLQQRNVVTLQNQVHNIWPITRVHHKTNYATRTTSSTRVNPPRVVDIPEGSETQ